MHLQNNAWLLPKTVVNFDHKLLHHDLLQLLLKAELVWNIERVCDPVWWVDFQSSGW